MANLIPRAAPGTLTGRINDQKHALSWLRNHCFPPKTDVQWADIIPAPTGLPLDYMSTFAEKHASDVATAVIVVDAAATKRTRNTYKVEVGRVGSDEEDESDGEEPVEVRAVLDALAAEEGARAQAARVAPVFRTAPSSSS